MIPPKFEPAPPRGRYDRAQSRAERQAEQKGRLLRATASVFDGQHTTVTLIVERAGISRNTFYEHFDDLAHALRSVRAQAGQLLEQRARTEMSEARTPIETVRALVRGLFAFMHEEPELAHVALDAALGDQRLQLSEAARVFEQLLGEALSTGRQSGAFSIRPEGVRLTAMAAAAGLIARACLIGSIEADTAQRTLVDLIVRSFH